MKKILALVLIALLTFCTCFASSVPVDVTGLWYAYLADGEATLFLRDDGTGSLIIGQDNFSISWMQSGSSITLDQGGALVSGVCDGTSISLAIGGGNLVFLRELPEPLSLDSDLTGTWIAHLPETDSLLVLNADGTAKLQMGPEAIDLDWTRNGADITLLQQGFPVVECAFDGVFISIFIGEGSLCFLRQADADENNP